MSNGEKKIVNCSSCNKTYNVASLKPGAKFKCSQCGTINTVPEPEPEPILLEEVEPTTPPKPVPPAPPKAAAPPKPTPPPPPKATEPTAPTQPPAPTVKPVPAKPVRPAAPPARPAKPAAEGEPRQRRGVAMHKGRPSVLAGRMGTRYSKLGKLGKAAKLARQAPGAKEAAGEGEEELPEPKKSNTPLIIGIVTGIVIIIGVIIFLVTSGKEEPIELEAELAEPWTEESEAAKPPQPKTPEPKSNWERVDPSLKAEVAAALRSFKQTKTRAESARIALDLIQNQGEAAISALIEIVMDNPDGSDAQFIVGLLQDMTRKEFGSPARRKPYTFPELAKKYRDWWLNKDILTPEYKFPPDELMKELNAVLGETPTAPTPAPPVSGFRIDATLRPEVLTVLTEIKDYRKNDTEWEDGAQKIMAMSKKDIIPILILEIANEDIEIGYTASELLIKWTKRTDAPTFNPMMAGMKQDVSKDWQVWWMKNKEED